MGFTHSIELLLINLLQGKGCTKRKEPGQQYFPNSTIIQSYWGTENNTTYICDSLMNQTLFSFIWMGKRVWCNSITSFALPDPHILGLLIGVDGVERLVNRV